MHKHLEYSLFVLILTFIIPIIGCQNNSSTIDKQLMEISNEINKTMLPMFVDQETRWDTSYPLPGKILVYIYTLPNHSINDFNESELNAIKTELMDGVRNTWKTSKEQLWYRQNKIRLKYIYRDKNGNVMFEYSFIAGQ